MTEHEQVLRWDASAHALEDAEGYQRDFVPPMFRPSAEGMLERVPPAPGARVLDAGCGTGVVALLAAERVGAEGRVAGLDLNPAQLAVAAGLPGADAVEWRQGELAELPYPAGSFDVAYCHHVLQFVPDRLGALRELRRVLARGGRLAVATWGSIERHPGFAALAAAFEERGEAETAAMMRSPRALADGDALVALLAEAGFDETRGESFEVDVRFPSAATFVEGLVPPDAQEVRAAALGELARVEGTDGFRIRDEVQLAVGRA